MLRRTQARLDVLWGLSPRADRDEKIQVSKETKEELDCRKFAEEVGVEYVKNGSRDRYGNLRRNIGGRPRKELDLKFSPSNRRSVGKKKRMEFGAVEKIEMLKKVNSIELSIADRLSRQPKEVQEMEARKVIRKEMPALRSKRKIDALKAQGPELTRIIFEKRLNKSLGRSRPAQLEYWCVSSGVRVRSKGAGRRNNFKTIWKRVQLWHTCQRLMDMQVDTHDIWCQLKDLAEKG